MVNLRARILLFVGVLLISGMEGVCLAAVQGDWVGTLQSPDRPSPIRLHLEGQDSALAGTVLVPSARLMMAPLGEVHSEAGHISFSVGEVAFSATTTGNTMSGEMKSGEKTTPFRMIQLAPVEPARYFGVYKDEDGRRIYIRTWDELGDNQLTYFDDSGEVGALYAESPTSFFSGPALMVALPQQAKVTFTMDRKGQVSGLTWHGKTGASKKAVKMESIREEEVTFKDGVVELAGTLVLPPGKGPHPAIVLVHGSGPVTRDFMGPIAYVFATRGIAALSYDKRGIGKSGGDWLEADFRDLAHDALAGVEYLKGRKEVDASRIGLFGISQGGWISPLAASTSADVGFIVMVSSPAVSPGAQDEMRSRAEMKLAGSSEEEINKAMSAYKEQIDGLMSPDGLAWVQGEIEKAKKEGNTALLSANGSENPRFLLWLRDILRYDPLPALEQTRCPVLAVYGELDRGVPVGENRDLLESTLKKGGNTNVTVVTFPKADHAMMECETGSASEFPYLHRFVPGFFDTMVEWVLKRKPANQP